MKFSRFGERFTQKSGISQLMDDLGNALNSKEPVNMLGGGNPAVIDEVNAVYRSVYDTLDDAFIDSIGNYSTPQGDAGLITALCDFFNRHYQWHISKENIALTNGSQNAFFYLLNMFAGEFTDGKLKKILLPLVPEYVGYADAHLDGNHFISGKPTIQASQYTTADGKTLDGFFKYGINFDELPIGNDIGAICCSRPTNPTGNMLTDAEMHQLNQLAQENDIPLIIDNAYGMPFPGIVFNQASLTWNQNIILCFSLSKIGLPGLRTGIVIANPQVIEAISAINAIVNLSPTRFGAAIATPLLHDDRLKKLSENTIRPFYRQKVDFAIHLLQSELAGYPLHIHRPEGAIFLWLWFENLPIDTFTLYQQLKAQGTIILPGEYFFPGVDIAHYPHAHQCIRMSYAQSDDTLRKGIADIGRLVRMAYDQNQ